MCKSENQSDLAAFNDIQSNEHSDYGLFNNNSLMPMQNSMVTANCSNNNYENQESGNNNLQSLTLTMGSGSKDSTCETTSDISTNTVEAAAAPRRTLETFGQRTSIYRGVTRYSITYYIQFFLNS